MREVWRFNQADFLPTTNPGVCMTLVAYWISLMRDDKTEANESGADSMRATCAFEARKLQNFYSGRFKADETVTWALRRMKLSGDYETCLNGRDVVESMTDKRCGYSIGIYFHGGGGHALGIWRSGRSSGVGSRFSGHTYFFDPNLGCFKGNTGSFAGWFDGFLRDHYRRTRKLEVAKVVSLEEARAHWTGAYRMV